MVAKTLASIVRHNIMTRPGYAPYCGALACTSGMPRTAFDGEQFACRCGWRSVFESSFIQKYRETWKKSG